jgi:heme exporter protein CcmB
VVWTTLAFAAIVGFARSFQLERRRDSLTALVTAPVGHGSLFVGKAAANLVLLVVLEVVLLPLAAVLFDFDLVACGAPLVLVLLLHTLGLALLGTLFGAVAAQVGRGEALLATLLFPAAAPILISAVQCTGKVFAGAGLAPVQHWLLVTAGLDVLFFLLGLATFEYVVED